MSVDTKFDIQHKLGRHNTTATRVQALKNRTIDGTSRTAEVVSKGIEIKAETALNGHRTKKDTEFSKNNVFEYRDISSSTAAMGQASITDRLTVNCKDSGGDLDIPKEVSDLDKQIEDFSNRKILAYSQYMDSSEAAEKAYGEATEQVKQSSLYTVVRERKIGSGASYRRLDKCGKKLWDATEELFDKYDSKEPDESIFNGEKTEQLRDISDIDQDGSISLNDVQPILDIINDPPPTPEEIAQQKRFEEQCFLIKYTNKLPGVSSENPSKKVFKLGSVENYSPDGFVNQLVKPPNYEQIFNITPAQLSGLTPSIELYKVFIDDDGREADVPIIMNTHTTKDEIDSFLGVYEVAQTYPLGRSRSIGAGMKSMTMEFDGNNFFTAKRNIKSKLKLFFASFEELLRSRRVTVTEQNGPGFESVDSGFRFIDLMMKTPSTIKSHRSSHQLDPNPRNYRLKAVFGWSELGGNQVLSDFFFTSKKSKRGYLKFIDYCSTYSCHTYN